MLRLGVSVLLVSAAAAIAASAAQAALFFLFAPTVAQPGDEVTVRLGGTPASFSPDQRRRPYKPGMRLYLVPAAVGPAVRSRFDRRLHFVGRLVPDKNTRGILSFTVPPLDTADYVVAAWCPGCARYSGGQTFFVQTIPRAGRYRALMGLRVEMPPATSTCPVTTPNDPQGWYGNGLLWTQLARSGDLIVLRRADGSLFQKLGWLPRKGFRGQLKVRGERLDAPSPPLRVLNVFWGYASSGPYSRGSWATPVEFPSEGCWRISARVGDVSLTYVANVVGR